MTAYEPLARVEVGTEDSCAECGRRIRYVGLGHWHDLTGFRQCRPRGNDYAAAPRVSSRVRLHRREGSPG